MKEKRLHIGLFNDSFFPMADGVIMVVDNYARRLVKYADVTVFVPEYSKKKFDDSQFPYEVVRCKSVKVPHLDYSLPLPKIDRKFLSKLNSYDLDIVHLHSPFTLGQAGLKYAKKRNIPCIATMHTQFQRDFKKLVKIDKVASKLNSRLIKLFNQCDECWAVNKEVARIYYENYKYKCLPRVMNNATEMLYTNHEEACEYINKLHGLSEDEIVFIFVGRLTTLKNILFIADAIAIVKELRPELKFKMLFVGSGQNESKLRKKINKLNINDKVILCGKVTDRNILAKYYSRANLMLFPSAYDSSSIVQIEAASQKTPVLFLENTATACMVEDNFNGFLSKFDAQAYAQRILEIIDNKELYNSVCENAFQTLYKTWDKAVEEVFNLYKMMIDKCKSNEKPEIISIK